MIDPPQWRWHGRLWSHLISDTGLDELHHFARVAGLRYLSFGFDHYDVPEELFGPVQELGAELVDPRRVVRSLRETGLRSRTGRAAKRWTRVPGSLAVVMDERGHGGGINGAPVLSPIVELADRAGRAVDARSDSAEVLARPGELAVVLSGPRQPADGELAELHDHAGDGVLVVTSPGPWGWAVELVIAT